MAKNTRNAPKILWCTKPYYYGQKCISSNRLPEKQMAHFKHLYKKTSKILVDPKIPKYKKEKYFQNSTENLAQLFLQWLFHNTLYLAWNGLRGRCAVK